MRLFQEELLNAASFFEQAILSFATGDYTVLMMVGGAIGGAYVLGVTKRSISRAFVGALGGAASVLAFWVLVNLVLVIVRFLGS